MMDKEIEIIKTTEEYILAKAKNGYVIFGRHDFDHRLKVGESLEDAIGIKIHFFNTPIFKTEKRAISHFNYLQNPQVEDKGTQLVKKTETGQRISSPRSYNYVIKETGEEGTVVMPHYKAGEESLIDFLFDRLRKKAKKMSTEERSLITVDNYRMVLLDREKFPIALTGDSFTTTEVRKKLNKRYPDKEMINDFKGLRSKPIQIKKGRIWADENGKYKDEIDWEGSILSDVVAVKRTKIAPRTGEPLHKIHLNIGYITGILWLNDIIRERHCLFPTKFYRLPKQCQKIFRYLSLWDASHLTIHDFSVILNYKSTANLTERKKDIEGYLNTLKNQEFIFDWRRVEGTRGLETKWYIRVVKKKD